MNSLAAPVYRAQTRLLLAVFALVTATAPLRGQTPVHVFDASSPGNVMSGQSLTQWTDVGPGHNYTGSPANIHVNTVTGLTQTPAFFSPATLLTASFTCGGANTGGGKSTGQPQSSSIGNGLTDGSFEIWFRTDLDDEDRPVWQVLWESGASVNGFCILLRTNGLGTAEMRVMKAWNSVKIVDMTVALTGIDGSDFIQAVATFDGGNGGGADTARLHVRDALGNSVFVEDVANDFNTLAGSDDTAVFNAANGTTLGVYGSCGGNVGNAVAMSAFKGEIALINVYSTALSSTDVLSVYGLIANQGDNDNDGIPNAWELINGLDPNDDTDAADDNESDGLTNLDEYNNGTDPNDPDSDDDGVSDGVEVAQGMDPLSGDSDGDGLGDAGELSANPFVTSPILADTDGDLVPDPLELMMGTDPTDDGSFSTSVLVSEFMASNGFTLDDEDGDSSDWIEIVNATTAPVDLGGMHLTDDPLNLTKWTFPPGVILQPGEFLLVFASGKDRAVTGQELHTNFTLDADGGYLALVDSDGSTIVQEFNPFPFQRSDVSFGFDELYLTDPTPGAVNIGPGVTGFVEDTEFSVGRGFFNAPFTVDITTATPGATIVYTTDSTTPTLSNGTQQTGTASVNISGTTILRAAAFKIGLAPANADTQTYLFLADVVTQSDDDLDYEYPNWNNLSGPRNADYGMDQDEIVGALYSHQDVIDSLMSLPTISIATDAAKLFDQQTGNYANSTQSGTEWEREVSMELFGFAHGQAAQIDGGLRMAGNASRSTNRHKHNMRIAFRREYGDGTLEFPLFEDSEVTTFNSIQLRGGNGDSWIHPSAANRPRAAYLRDQWHRDVHIEMGGASQVQRYAHLYINGLYWGVFHIFERIEDDYMVEHFGGKELDWDVRDHVGTFNGTEAAWLAAFAIADDPATMADPGNYAAIQQYIDFVDLIDYVLVHFYSNSDDWDQNNVRAARNRVDPDTFKYFCWDQERTLLNSLSTPDVNGARAIDKDTNTNTRMGPTHIHQQLRANPEYRLLFGDRVRKHCFHGGPLTPLRAAQIWDSRAAELRPAIIAESARWGDLHDAVANKPSHWETQVALEKTGWFDIRTPLFVSLLQARDLYPMTAAPDFTINASPQHGGPATPGSMLGITAPAGTIYYTLNGTDPRAVGGAVQGTEFTSSFPLTQSVTIKARALDTGTGEWSALTEVDFDLVSDPGFPTVLVNEVLAHTDLPEVDSIELHNPDPNPVDIGGWFLTDNFSNPQKYRIPDGTMIPGGGYIVFGENHFSIGPNAFRLSEHGEEVYLFSGNPIGQLTGYFQGRDFKASPNGVTIGRHVDSQGKEHFVLQSANTLGAANSPPLAGPVVVSEIHYHPPDFAGGVDNDLDEFIELTNISNARVPLYSTYTNVPGYGNAALNDTWRLRNAVDFDFPPGVELNPGELAVVVGFDPVANAAQLASFRTKFDLPEGVKIFGPWSGKLDNSGEEIELKFPGSADPDDSFSVPYYLVEEIDYRDSAPWPAAADGTGSSLRRLQLSAFANDPLNWSAASPMEGIRDDSDNDQMEDWWEYLHGLNVGVDDSASDLDSDGFSNIAEYIAKTSPSDSRSYPHLVINTTQTGLSLRFIAAPDVAYTIETTDSLSPPANWQIWQTIAAGPQQREMLFQIDPTEAKRFYRLIIPAIE